MYGMKKKFRGIKICGENLSSRPEILPQFRAKFENIIQTEGFPDSQIYNADGSAL